MAANLCSKKSNTIGNKIVTVFTFTYKMSKNKLNLTLPPGSLDQTPIVTPTSGPFQESSGQPNTLVRGDSLDNLTARLEELDMNDTEKKRIEVFLCEKEKIGVDLSDDDFEKLGELGSVKPAIKKQIIRELK
ncbi:Dsor1 [Trypoxylus dichotomus]